MNFPPSMSGEARFSIGLPPFPSHPATMALAPTLNCGWLSMSRLARHFLISGTLLVLPSLVFAGEEASSFIKQNCLDCHRGESAEAGFDLDALADDLHDPATLNAWIKAFDRVQAGEMPPADYGEVDVQEQQAFLAVTGDWLRNHQQDEFDRLGRVRGRRLTNRQLERTLHDLLAIDVPLASMMSEEPRSHGFNNIADAQAMSHFQLESHLQVVDTALDAAFERATQRDEDVWRREYSARDLARDNPERRCRDPEMRKGLAVVWSHGLIFYGRISSTTMRESGWYRFTVKASAVKQPDEHGVWCTVRSGRCSSGAPLMTWIGAFEATERPEKHTFEAWIPAGHMIEIRPGDETLPRARTQGGQVGTGECEDQDVPGVAMHSMQIERIFPGGSAQQVRQNLFGRLRTHVNKQGQLVVNAAQTSDDLVDQLRKFTTRAFRRQVPPEQLDAYERLLLEELDAGTEASVALRKTYRAVLCSPRFLYFVEPVGELDDYAIASRLSYLFTGSMPNQKLFELAQQGQLRNPEVLQAEVERLLAGEGGAQFVKIFADQWLDLVDIDFTDPDRKLHRDFDIVVQDAMLAETRAYLQDLIETNAPITRLIDSDYTFLNSRLARYYGIEGVAGDQLRKVRLDRDDQRGGLLAQGAILKVTANGTNTSPVLRGVWMCERILGQPIPAPPENVPAIEPDIRGAATIREMLDKHRSDTSCASCHVKIDPAGFALENFDAAGRWRDRYAQLVSGKVQKGSPVDPSYSLADGRAFTDFRSFRKLITQTPEPLARNFAEKLLIFATGAPIAFADRDEIDRIVAATADDQFGMRKLVHAAIQSEIFLRK
jgi:hypothetical protein